jgi:hypothetical protein
MYSGGDLAVVVEGGLLRPEKKLNYPDHTRLVIRVERVETTPEAAQEAQRIIEEIGASGQVHLDGWHPTRDEMHERS